MECVLRPKTIYHYTNSRGCSVTATRPAICNTKPHRADALEKRVWDAVKRMLHNPEAILIALEHPSEQVEPPPIDAEREQIKQEVAELKRQQAAFLQAIKGAPAAAAAITGELDKVAKELSRIERQLRSTDKPAKNLTATNVDPALFKQVIDELYHRMNAKDSIEEQKETLKRLHFRASMKDDGTLTININLPDGTGAPVPPPEAVSEANSIHHWTNMGMTT